MNPISFPEANKLFTTPEGMTKEQCGDLPTWEGLTMPDAEGNRFPKIISCWEVSPEELEQITRTRKIWLHVSGYGMPPVRVDAEYPFVIIEKESDVIG